MKLRSILREYLESQRAQHEDEGESVYVADLMQAWAFASQVEKISSQITGDRY